MSKVNVSLEPSESLTFSLSSDSSPQAALTLTNNEDEWLSFKVKTTRPLRYLVRPNQGVIKPKESATIMLILNQKDQEELLRLDPQERTLSNDKFLVQSISIDEEFGSQIVQKKDAKEAVEELTKFWSSGLSKEKLHNKKLRCMFTQDSKPSSSSSSSIAANGSSSADRKESTADDRKRASSSLSNSLLNKENVEEVAVLRKKYDELVAFTVQLTAQRDILMNDLNATRSQLQETQSDLQKQATSSSDNISGLRQRALKLNKSDNMDTQKHANSSPLQNKESLSFLHLLVCALVFFLAGRYFG